MQISSRFAEYGLTGGFFWICQLLVLWASGTGPRLLSSISATQLAVPSGASDITKAILTSLAGALAIIAVFVAGLLLDLLASHFLQLEMLVFKRHLDRNSAWLDQLAAKHRTYCGADYEGFRSRFGEASFWKSFVAGFDAFAFWNPERRKRYRAALAQGLGRWRLVRSYGRLWSFFAAYVVVLSGSSQLSLMIDQYYLWRTGRAISTALLIAFFEAQFTGVWSSLAVKFESLWAGFAFGLVTPLLLTAIAMLITLATYSRLCFTLFSLVYVTQESRAKENHEDDSVQLPG